MGQTLVVSDLLAALARMEGLPAAVAAATSAVDGVLRDRGLRLVSPETVGQARWASARVKGMRGLKARRGNRRRGTPPPCPSTAMRLPSCPQATLHGPRDLRPIGRDLRSNGRTAASSRASGRNCRADGVGRWVGGHP